MYFDINNYVGNSQNYDGYFSSSDPFDLFQRQNPTYLSKLKSRVDILFRTYSALHASRYAKLEEDPQLSETANLLSFGLLMRHALETISIDLFMKAGYDKPKEKTANERLKAIEGKNIYGYTHDMEKQLFYILDRTNKVAHPHVIENAPAYKRFVELYRSALRPLIDYHIRQTTKISIRQYLKSMKKRMDSFSLKDKITKTLALGNLVRQLTECTVNFWCYHQRIVPTDGSTAENPISLSQLLTSLDRIAKANKKYGDDASLIWDTTHTLFDLKNASNGLMHVAADEISLFKIWKASFKIRSLHSAIVNECSPGALELKTDTSVRNKTQIKLALLCGFLGWFGVHHFYAGNILKGILFLLTSGGFLVGTPISLIRIYTGRFHTKKWGHLKKVSRAARTISIVFLLIYAALFYFFVFAK